ncbi:50S ribosomal protein L35 [Patescibacteria group bacterium]|nr:50S ribosomal protein L35 [Patescibacteria group bacterium]
MPKLKTRKTLLKRIKITGRKKITKRPTHQNHLNAKESGNKTRSKRKSRQMSLIDSRFVKKVLPGITK